jgi:hypothetical protein
MPMHRIFMYNPLLQGSQVQIALALARKLSFDKFLVLLIELSTSSIKFAGLAATLHFPVYFR